MIQRLWDLFSYDALNTPANETALFCLLKNKPLFVRHYWPITALGESINSVVRERALKNGISCYMIHLRVLKIKRFDWW
jgi:hypothetical protein